MECNALKIYTRMNDIITEEWVHGLVNVFWWWRLNRFDIQVFQLGVGGVGINSNFALRIYLATNSAAVIQIDQISGHR